MIFFCIRTWNGFSHGFSQECDFGPLNDLNPGMVNPGASESKTRSIKAAEFFYSFGELIFQLVLKLWNTSSCETCGKTKRLCFGDSGCILLFRSNHLGNRMRIGNRQRSHPSGFSSGIWWKNPLKCPGFQRFQYRSHWTNRVTFYPRFLLFQRWSNHH